MEQTEYAKPVQVALAEKFFWEIFLTDKWDYLFKNSKILPRQTHNHAPRIITWGAGEYVKGDTEVVHLIEANGADTSMVTIGMQVEPGTRHNSNGGKYPWHPNSVKIDVYLHPDDQAEFNASRLVIPITKVFFI